MPKKQQPIEAEMFSYEEYCVYELIKEKDKGISLFGPRFGVDTPFGYDLYAPDGIPSLGFIGKTAVEVKQHLSFATITETTSHYEKHGAEYNILVVYFKSSISNYPPAKTNEQGKSFVYMSFKELKDKYKRGRGTGTCPKPKSQRFTCLFPHLSLQREDGNNSSINENVDLSLVA